jgi:hypothetical protein
MNINRRQIVENIKKELVDAADGVANPMAINHGVR